MFVRCLQRSHKNWMAVQIGFKAFEDRMRIREVGWRRVTARRVINGGIVPVRVRCA
jgi:hypothetical protein